MRTQLLWLLPLLLLAQPEVQVRWYSPGELPSTGCEGPRGPASLVAWNSSCPEPWFPAGEIAHCWALPEGRDRPAQALRCHECTAVGNCVQPITCQDATRYCLTTWNSPPGQRTFVIKSCAYTCPGYQESLAYSRASCCNTDLCNGAGSPRARWGLLALSLGVAYLCT